MDCPRVRNEPSSITGACDTCPFAFHRSIKSSHISRHRYIWSACPRGVVSSCPGFVLGKDGFGVVHQWILHCHESINHLLLPSFENLFGCQGSCESASDTDDNASSDRSQTHEKHHAKAKAGHESFLFAPSFQSVHLLHGGFFLGSEEDGRLVIFVVGVHDSHYSRVCWGCITVDLIIVG